MITLLGDPRVTEALIVLTVGAISALGAIGALIVRQTKAYMEAKFAHVLAGVEETRAAAQSADSEVRNSHETNIRDDIDKTIETVWAVSDQVGELAEQVRGLAEQGKRMEEALEAHGQSLKALQARVDRLGEELHDERTARESSQRVLDEHAHDAHARLHDRLDKLEKRQEQWQQR